MGLDHLGEGESEEGTLLCPCSAASYGSAAVREGYIASETTAVGGMKLGDWGDM